MGHHPGCGRRGRAAPALPGHGRHSGHGYIVDKIRPPGGSHGIHDPRLRADPAGGRCREDHD